MIEKEKQQQQQTSSFLLQGNGILIYEMNT